MKQQDAGGHVKERRTQPGPRPVAQISWTI